jgi:hypothetical protein
MEAKKIDKYEDEKDHEVNIDEYLTRILGGIESFLNKVQKHDQNAFKEVIANLQQRLASREIEISLPEVELPLITQYPKLKQQVVNYVCEPFEKYQSLTKQTKTVTCTVKTWLQSRLFLSYQMAKSLTSIMAKEKAIQFFQDYIDEETRKVRDPTQYRETLIDEKEIMAFFETYASHNSILFTVNEWKAGQKMLKCKWHEVMKKLNDPDFTYAVACHYDFEATKNTNPAFTLTRTKTLMQGDECCDFCLHDTRQIAVAHPPESFWKELNSDNTI